MNLAAVKQFNQMKECFNCAVKLDKGERAMERGKESERVEKYTRRRGNAHNLIHMMQHVFVRGLRGTRNRTRRLLMTTNE